MENLDQSIASIGFRFYVVHFISLIFLIVLLWFAYIKIMYPFWNTQPMFHSYDFWRYWITVPFIIMHKRGQKPGKFCDFDNVVTMNFLDMPTELYLGMLDLLQCHYINDESVLFLFHRENLDAYFAGHLFPSYISFYMNSYSDIGVLDVSGDGLGGLGDDLGGGIGDIVTKKRSDACITSRSVVLKSCGIVMNVYFMDFITLRRGGNVLVSRKLMATHCWRTLDFVNGIDGIVSNVDKRSDKRSKVDKINAAFFRKEGDAFAGIQAFFAFDASIFKIDGSFAKPLLPMHFSLVSIHAKNAGLLTDFLDVVGSQFDLFITASIANLMELVKRRVLFLFLVRRGDNSFCFYAFRDTRTQYDFANSNDDSLGGGGGGGGALLQFVCSIQKSNSHELFYRGFLNALHDILNYGSGKAFKYLMVDDVGDNRAIANDFPASTLLEKIAVNYYGYNLVVPTVNNAFVLV